jgi:PD-(D/E)XK nuclease superfamily protein
MLTTDQKGAIAEAAIIKAAVELGLGVSRPVLESRYDLVFDLGSELLRVQCKWARRVHEVIVVACQSHRRSASGTIRRLYARHEVDAFAAYCPDTSCCYFIPFDDVPASGSLNLRLSPARNGQSRGIRWASEYEFAATLMNHGAIAQLGERRAGSAKVTGSNPVGSITDRALRTP